MVAGNVEKKQLNKKAIGSHINQLPIILKTNIIILVRLKILNDENKP